ncbi:MAG: single-stranded-DNA-specific exonuclease RecJ [Firmicutes bacterium]|jgi:single-stranded-DNA-specific exonuclease|nr:single-stranded-DNA-specific exonuclease RecJ [Dethiobacter sp.]MBS3897231.1 single-stranded-DNA-specific exonuclease RecJ [Dethiobacter sp.]MCL4462527.1 single-stranded-DNA-specific exonuclease RecJ [Bacillota bacterium]MCL5993154.1 single-stranded-DNA-specific exonuclease RecJ [Bacillota bacterium]
MSVKQWRWVAPEIDWSAVKRLSETMKLHRLTAACLMQRGVSTAEEARFFLNGSLTELADPFAMAGMEEAVQRLANAVAARETLLIYGDYDADGVTSVALLTRALQKLGVPVEYYLPSRLGDGYGLHGQILSQFAAAGGKLVLTVDCGINSFEEMDLAKQLAIDLIVTDHHEAFPGARSAYAVLNPKQLHCSYPERNLAGVGVAWTLVRALYSRLGVPFAEAAELLDLVAVGSIADVVPLLGENRILVKAGLEELAKGSRPGLAALARLCGRGEGKLTAQQVAFGMAPRLNAPGRLGDALPALQALLASPAEAEQLALDLDEKNRLRQQVEKDILGNAREQAAACEDAALVLWHQDWHPGVIGIVAGRLAAEFGKPTVLIALDGEEGRGSIRSVPGCNLMDALQLCAKQLIRFGGHPEAAGLSVGKANLALFQADFCRAVELQGVKEGRAMVMAEAQPADLSLALVEELTGLEPFGQGNPEPLFLLREIAVVTARRVGAQGAHLQLRLQKESRIFNAICFGGGDKQISAGETVDAAVLATANTWQGQTALSLQVRALRISPPE